MEQHDRPTPEPPFWPGHFKGRPRPPWWPENEPWPPARKEWRRNRLHSPFFRRLGCLFVLLSLLGLAIFAIVFSFIIGGFGSVHAPIDLIKGVLPVGGIFLALLIILMVLAGTNLHRFSVSLDNLLTASNRVAEGDYSARVEEKGPPEILSLTKSFNSMTSRLQSNDQQKRALLADISHELRTPLTIIRGNLEGMLDGLYPADEDKLRSILEETHLLARLIEDLRTLALAESGELQLKREPTDICALIRESITILRSQADTAGIELQLSLADEEWVLNIDPERIHQVLSNLVNNALRYTPRGGYVRVSLTDSASVISLLNQPNQVDRNKMIVVSVTDTGPGISPLDLPHIFDRFFKSTDSHGMGLGLSISKYIVEAHGGKITASSNDGGGTTISFSLPF